MRYKIMALLCALALTLCMTGCSKETETTTLTGIVVSVDGTVVSLQEFDSEMPQMPADGEMPSMPADGEVPSMPADMEGAEAPEGLEEFDPENFDGTMPSDMQEPPEGEPAPELPEGETRPEFPEGETPQEKPTGEDGGMTPGFGAFGDQGESTTVDLANAHISVEIDGGKATGSMEDITVGSLLTITLNADGEATNVVVSSASGFDKEFRSIGE